MKKTAHEIRRGGDEKRKQVHKKKKAIRMVRKQACAVNSTPV